MPVEGTELNTLGATIKTTLENEADTNTVTDAEKSAIDNLPADTVTAIADEALARAQADSNVQDNIDAESASRIAADSALQAAIDALAALSHPLGTYADEAAIITAHSSASAGDYVINLETDTVWIWDAEAGPAAWVDSGTTASMTGSQIATALFAEDDTNNYSDAEKAKVDAALPASDVLDEDDFATDSATLPPSQQSVDARILARATQVAIAALAGSTHVRWSDGAANDYNHDTDSGGSGGGSTYTTSNGRIEITTGSASPNQYTRLMIRQASDAQLSYTSREFARKYTSHATFGMSYVGTGNQWFVGMGNLALITDNTQAGFAVNIRQSAGTPALGEVWLIVHDGTTFSEANTGVTRALNNINHTFGYVYDGDGSIGTAGTLYLYDSAGTLIGSLAGGPTTGTVGAGNGGDLVSVRNGGTGNSASMGIKDDQIIFNTHPFFLTP